MNIYDDSCVPCNERKGTMIESDNILVDKSKKLVDIHKFLQRAGNIKRERNRLVKINKQVENGNLNAYDGLSIYYCGEPIKDDGIRQTIVDCIIKHNKARIAELDQQLIDLFENNKQ